MKLYSYWRSTTSYRVRIALLLKGLAFETVPVDLLADQQRSDGYSALNPGQGVPTLVLGNGTVLTQSMAILEYLDGVAPDPRLLPDDPIRRAQVQAAAFVIAMDIHPVNNLKVVNRIKEHYGVSAEASALWMRHWMVEGFRAFQAMLPDGPNFSFSDQPLMSDICLIPQVYNARRWGVDMSPFGRLLDIEREALKLSAFDAARPENQPDAPLKDHKI